MATFEVQQDAATLQSNHNMDTNSAILITDVVVEEQAKHNASDTIESHKLMEKAEVKLVEMAAKVQAAKQERQRLERLRDSYFDRALQQLPGSFISTDQSLDPRPLSRGRKMACWAIVSVFGLLWLLLQWQLWSPLSSPWPARLGSLNDINMTSGTATATANLTLINQRHHSTAPSSCSDLNLQTPLGPVEQADLLGSLIERRVMTFPKHVLTAEEAAELLATTQTLALGMRRLRIDLDHTLASGSSKLLNPPCALTTNYNSLRCRKLRESVADSVVPLADQSTNFVVRIDALTMSLWHLSAVDRLQADCPSSDPLLSWVHSLRSLCWHSTLTSLGQLINRLFWPVITTTLHDRDRYLKHARLLLSQLQGVLGVSSIELQTNMVAAFVAPSPALSDSAPGFSPIDERVLRASHHLTAVREYRMRGEQT